MNIDKVVNFPFPTRPSYEALASAETLLTNLGALKLPAEIQQKKKYKSDSGMFNFVQLNLTVALTYRHNNIL